MRFMTPVCILTDGYIANGSEPWRIPDVASLKPTQVEHPKGRDNGEAATAGDPAAGSSWWH